MPHAIGGGMIISRRHALLAAMASISIPRDVALGSTPPRPNLVIPIKLLRDRLVTTIAFEKEKDELMLVDTGAFISSISSQRAKDLKLRISSRIPLAGLGGREEVNIVRTKGARLGGVYEIPEMWLATKELLNATKYKATLGSEMLSSAHGELDFEYDQWRVYFDGKIDRTGYVRVEDSFRSNGWMHDFQIGCTVDGVIGMYHVDTGSPTNMIIDGPATAKLSKWNSQQPYAPWRVRGYGQARARTRLYRVGRVAVQGIEMVNPLLLLSNPNVALSNFENFDGLIGLRALRHFHISIDPESKALWLAPNGLRFDDDLHYPMSGLWLEEKGGRVLVDEVGIGSPAAGADIRVGDLIVGEAFDVLITKINGRAGIMVPLTIERNGQRLSKELTLQPFL